MLPLLQRLFKVIFAPSFERTVFQVKGMERYFVVNACESVDQKIFTLLESARINEVSIWISIIKVLVEKRSIQLLFGVSVL